MNLKNRFAQMFGENGEKTARMFTASTDGDVLTIELHGDIGDFWNENDSESFSRILNQNKSVQEIQLNIHSLGGYYFEGLGIMNQLRQHPAKVTATVMGVAASMASLILMAADEIRVHEASLIMIHEATTCSCGRANRLQTDAELLMTMNQQAAQIYHEKTGLPLDEIQRMMSEETWMTGQQALKLGFADELIPFKKAEEIVSEKMKALVSQPISFSALDVYNNIPLHCLSTDKTAALMGRINKSSLRKTLMAKDKSTLKQIEAAKVVLAASEIKPPTVEELAAAKNVLANVDIEPTGNVTPPVESSAKAEATEISQLCQLAGKPEKIVAFLTAGKTPDEVRIELAAVKQAELNAIPPVNAQFGVGVNLEKTKTLSQMALESCKKQGLIH